MLPYTFSPLLFLRAPAFSFKAFGMGKLQEMLDSPYFRSAIYFASIELYRQAELNNFCCDRMSERTRQSLFKYFNRMCYRATPFGMCSAFSAVLWTGSKDGICLSGEEKLHIRADFRLSVALARILAGNGNNDRMVYYSNPSLYTFGKELRYIKTLDDGENAEQAQGIAAVERNQLLCRLLRICQKGIRKDELHSFLKEQATEEEAVVLFQEMVSEELILSAGRPNVTGENYLKRIAKLSGNSELAGFVCALDEIRLPAEVNVPELEKLVKHYIHHCENLRHPYYVNFQRNVKGSLHHDYQGILLKGLYCLSRMQQNGGAGAINQFKREYITRFEDREIPLLLALDPEGGIGYGQLEQSMDAGDLLKGITFTRAVAEKQIIWGPLQELLMRRICTAAPENQAITLSDQDIAGLPFTEKGKYPPGISVMFRIYQGKVFIEEAGGVCATSLTGRFTPFDEQVGEQVRALADAEQEQNKEVIFAEIAHFTDEHAANINIRDHIRGYEIPVLVHSTLPAEQVISLNDLYVSVYQGEVIIRSARLNRRIIPRLSSAYNHNRSELPVFRFLCDLQYQGLAARFGLNAEGLLPGLDYYPRIEYKGCILSPTIWILKQGDLPKHTGKAAYEAFRLLAETRHISRFFALSSADRYLVFDLEDPAGIQIFLSEAGHSGTIKLEEFFIPDEENAILRNENGSVCVHQFVASLMCTERTYTHSGMPHQYLKNIQRDFIPGDEWLYFKIYCTPQNADYMLAEKIYPLIKKYLRSGEIEQWFFIRYYEQGHHLRIRLKAKSEAIREMPGLFNRMLKPLIESGMITRVLLDTYKREIERYGAKSMESAERAFMSSSELVAVHLSRDTDELRTIRFAILSTNCLLNSFKINLSFRIKLLENICRNLMAELGFEKQLRDDLNRKYREHQRGIRELISEGYGILSAAEKSRFGSFERNLCSLNEELFSDEPLLKAKFASDILHMHMNRIFSTEQRKKELVIYYLCLRYYLSEHARNGIRAAVMSVPVLH